MRGRNKEERGEKKEEKERRKKEKKEKRKKERRKKEEKRMKERQIKERKKMKNEKCFSDTLVHNFGTNCKDCKPYRCSKVKFIQCEAQQFYALKATWLLLCGLSNLSSKSTEAKRVTESKISLASEQDMYKFSSPASSNGTQ